MSPSLPARLHGWLSAPPEIPLVVEIAGDYVAALRHRHGRVEAWAARALPEGAVRPAPIADNVADRGAVQETLEHVLGSVANGERRCALLVPDLLARVFLLEFDHLPDRPEEAEALLRWRLSKDLPFDAGQAVLSYQKQAGRDTRQEVFVAACLRNLVRQYEECAEAAGLRPGWVTLSTLAGLGWLDSSQSAPCLLVKRDCSSLGLMVVQDGAIRLFRAVPLAKGAAGLSEEAVFEKVYPAVVYFQDHWGQPVTEAILMGDRHEERALARRLEQEVGCSVAECNPAALELPPSPVSAAPPDQRLAPALGWIRGGA